MNSVLAQIYGTGFEKAASADQELDFNNMSAAELLAGLEDGSIVFEDDAEKVAGDEGEIDLSQMTGAELLQLIEAADEVESEKTAGVMLEKMAQDGTLDYFDMAGRIMAHAYADEFSKVASSDSDEIEVDLNEISGEQLMELIDAGYEFDTDAEKVAKAKGMLERLGAWAKKPKTTYDRSMAAQQRQADAGHPAARGAVGRRIKALTTAAKKNPGQAAAATTLMASPAVPAAVMMKKKKDD
jgi:hypothetical protein